MLLAQVGKQPSTVDWRQVLAVQVDGCLRHKQFDASWLLAEINRQQFRDTG